MRKKTNSEFLKELKEKCGEEYIPQEEYRGSHTKIKVVHRKCGHTIYVTPSSLFSGRKCRYCSYKKRALDKRMGLEVFKKRMYEMYGNEYTVLGDYINSQTKIKVQHNRCGRVLNLLPASLLQGNGCTHCNHGDGLRSNTSEFKNKVYNVWGNEYSVIGEYVDSHTKIKMRHNSCGRVFLMRPNNVLNGQGCRVCRQNAHVSKIRKTIHEYKREVYDLTGNEYLVLGKEYINAQTPIKMKHINCGREFSMRPTSFLGGERCPYCAWLGASKGEREVIKYLDGFSLLYQYGYRIPDLRLKNNLHFDFWLPQPNVAIEYDGEQHFKPFAHFGGEDNFKKVQLRDRMKDSYCKNKGINLIRIRYDEDVKEVLDLHLLPLVKHLEGIKKEI